MPRWLGRTLRRVWELAAQRRVRFTLKAQRELAALGLGLDPNDACDVLTSLRSGDSAGRVVSHLTGEWMFVFKPRVAETSLYLKLILRDNCVVVSFHDEGGARDDQNA